MSNCFYSVVFSATWATDVSVFIILKTRSHAFDFNASQHDADQRVALFQLGEGPTGALALALVELGLVGGAHGPLTSDLPSNQVST